MSADPNQVNTAPTSGNFRDFDAEELEPLPPSGEFQLGGRRWSVKNRDDVEVGNLIAVAKLDGDVVQFQPGEFFAQTIVDDQAEDFAKLLASPPPGVTRRKIREVMTHVFELVSDFPTSTASGSSRASSARARKPKSSKARSSSPATRRKASGE